MANIIASKPKRRIRSDQPGVDAESRLRRPVVDGDRGIRSFIDVANQFDLSMNQTYEAEIR
jgi:hypothetical protein